MGVNRDGKGSPLKQDVFDLGLLLLVAALGGTEILHSKELQRISSRPSTACCVLHCGNEVASQAGYLTIPQYFTTKRYSSDFLDFLCKSLRFSETDRLCLEELQRHAWVTSRVGKGSLVSLKELMQIGRQWRCSGTSSEQQGTAEGQLDKLCAAMAAVLPCCKNYEAIIATFARGQIEWNAVEELAQDTGLNATIVWEKLMETIKGIQGSKNKV